MSMANWIGGEGTRINWSFHAKQPHLPPKSPSLGGCTPPEDNNKSLFPNSSNFVNSAGGQKQHQRTPSANFLPHAPIDELLDVTHKTPIKKGSHRRSSSDSVTFLDAPPSFSRIDEVAQEEFIPRKVVPKSSSGCQGFDKFDEGQLMFMLADLNHFQKQQIQSSDVCTQKTSVIENPSTPSDHNSVTQHPFKNKQTGGLGSLQGEPEVQSAHKIDHTFWQAINGESSSSSTPMDSSLDLKGAKRILANRQSAQRSRVRKLQYIAELERSVNILEAEVSALSSQVAYLDHQRLVLAADNSVLKQRIAALTQENLFKDAHYDAVKQEVQRLRQLLCHRHQQQQQMLHLEQDVSYILQQHANMLGANIKAESKSDVDKTSFASAVPEETDFSAINNPENPSCGMLKPVGVKNFKFCNSDIIEESISVQLDYST